MHTFISLLFLVTCLGLGRCTSPDTTLKAYLDQPIRPGEVLASTTVRVPEGEWRHMTFSSLEWRKDDVSPSRWRHHLKVFIPRRITSSTAFLYVSNGTLNESRTEPAHPLIKKIALENNCIAIEIRLVPNQGLTFFDEPEPRVEDDLVAYSWKQYLLTGDRKWIVQYPMVKSVQQVMDYATAEWQTGTDTNVESFVVAGQSKRGWVSWLIAALDDRVAGVVPMVIDLVNIEPSMAHHKRVYGGWSWPLKDYTTHGIAEILGTPKFEPIASQLDPLRYKDQLTMPKLIINSANDQFFLPDSSQFYFSQLPEPKLLRYIPNVGHQLPPQTYLDSVSTFVHGVLHKQPFPVLSWKIQNDTIEVRTDTKPVNATLWVAHNAEARDFRLAENYAHYKPTKLAALDRKLLIEVPSPDRGWHAYFVEYTFDVSGRKLTLSTPVWVKGAEDPRQD